MLSVILLAIPAFMLFMLIEYLVAKAQGKKVYFLNDTISNLSQGIGNQVVSLLTKAFLAAAFVWTYQNFALFPDLFRPTWYNAILCLIVFDGLYYWAHRWSHEWNFLWAAHVVHHQSEEYNLSVALRQPWFHHLLAFFVLLPVPVLGFEPMMIIGVGAFVTLYQFWIHTKTINRMPAWFEFIFNTPSHHRVHHARDPKYLDKNHGAVFIIWDRIFGTYKEEEEEPTYGITTPFHSYNPVWGNFHHWAEMWQLFRQAPRWADKFKVLFARPGWKPEELGGYQPAPEIDEKTIRQYNPKVSDTMRLYVILQFSATLLGLTAYMYNFGRLSYFYQILFFVILILSTVICGAILENKRWVRSVEYIRLVVIVLSLNTLYYFCFIDWLTVMLICSIGLTLSSVIFFTWSWRRALEQQPKLNL